MLFCGTYHGECAFAAVWTRSPEIPFNHYNSVVLWSSCSRWQLRQSLGTAVGEQPLGIGTVCGLSALRRPCWGNHIWAGQGWSCPLSSAMGPLLGQAILMPACWGLLSEPCFSALPQQCLPHWIVLSKSHSLRQKVLLSVYTLSPQAGPELQKVGGLSPAPGA